MIKVTGARIPVSKLDQQSFIADLMYFERPVLSLYRDDRTNWMHLWVDANDDRTVDRYLIFPTRRSGLVKYLEGTSTLGELLSSAKQVWLLESTIHPIDEGRVRQSHRFVRRLDAASIPDEYRPAPDAMFNEALAPDISLARELTPSRIVIPIGGEWFWSDLDRFTALYGQLYAFLYCTQPRLVTNLGIRVAKYLRAPWRGGFSRVNLFDGLDRLIPSLHALLIKKLKYESPGDIQVEALATVGDSIRGLLGKYLSSENELLEQERVIRTILSSGRLNTRDLSKVSDVGLPLTDAQIGAMRQAHTAIASSLEITGQLQLLAQQSPNLVVTSKVLLALLDRIGQLAAMQRDELINLLAPTTSTIQQEAAGPKS